MTANLINTDKGGHVIGVMRIGLIKKCGARPAGAHTFRPLGIGLGLPFREHAVVPVIVVHKYDHKTPADDATPNQAPAKAETRET